MARSFVLLGGPGNFGPHFRTTRIQVGLNLCPVPCDENLENAVIGRIIGLFEEIGVLLHTDKVPGETIADPVHNGRVEERRVLVKQLTGPGEDLPINLIRLDLAGKETDDEWIGQACQQSNIGN